MTAAERKSLQSHPLTYDAAACADHRHDNCAAGDKLQIERAGVTAPDPDSVALTQAVACASAALCPNRATAGRAGYGFLWHGLF
jgi:hypothetical protein